MATTKPGLLWVLCLYTREGGYLYWLLLVAVALPNFMGGKYGIKWEVIHIDQCGLLVHVFMIYPQKPYDELSVVCVCFSGIGAGCFIFESIAYSLAERIGHIPGKFWCLRFGGCP